MATTLRFNLQGRGWASLEVQNGSTKTVIESISYLTNALDDLVRMGLDVATDKAFAFARFDHEPAETILIAETGWWEGNDWHQGGRLSVVREVPSEFEPNWNWRQTANAESFFDVQSRDDLARLFLDLALRVREEHGEEGYSKLWCGQLGFPRRSVAALEIALSTPPSEVKPYE
ncbi:MAG TPA: hypothetical protein VNA29_08635 [Sphingomicrobium sp.]|nr:hypothetical protein [Sphingomicrobium sp.]